MNDIFHIPLYSICHLSFAIEKKAPKDDPRNNTKPREPERGKWKMKNIKLNMENVFLVHIERAAVRFRREVRAGGILQDLVQLQNICLEVRVFRQSA